MTKLIKVTDQNMWCFECIACNCSHYFNNTWVWNGSYELPTVSPSIFVNPGGDNPETPQCHMFIRDGKIEYLSDCTHEYAGKTIEMVEI